MKFTCVLGAEVLHRVDAEAANDRQVALHPGDLEESALVRELEEAIGADASLLGQPLAIDAERRPMEQLIRMPDPARSQPPNIVIGDSTQVFERPIHTTSMRGNPRFPLRAKRR